jgi:hypothetical protein
MMMAFSVGIIIAEGSVIVSRFCRSERSLTPRVFRIHVAEYSLSFLYSIHGSCLYLLTASNVVLFHELSAHLDLLNYLS